MTGVRLDYDRSRLDALTRAPERLARAVGGNAMPLMDAVGAALVSGTQRRFGTATDPGGMPWKESERARTKERGGKTLTDTGRLQGSIGHRPSPDAVQVGSNVIYAAIHQLGGEIRPKKADALKFMLPDGTFIRTGKVSLPARPYLGIDDADEVAVEDVVETFVSRALTGPGGVGRTRR